MTWPLALVGAWIVVVTLAVRSVAVDGNWIGLPVGACFLVAIAVMVRYYLDVKR